MTPTLMKTSLRRKPKVITTIRLDPDMKREAQIITRNMGIDLSTFLNMQVTELVTTRQLKVDMREVASPEVLAELREVERDMELGINMSPTFTDAKSFTQYLRSL